MISRSNSPVGGSDPGTGEPNPRVSRWPVTWITRHPRRGPVSLPSTSRRRSDVPQIATFVAPWGTKKASGAGVESPANKVSAVSRLPSISQVPRNLADGIDLSRCAARRAAEGSSFLGALAILARTGAA